MVVIVGEARLLGFGRRDARSEVDRLYRKHADEVLRYAMLVLRSQPDAEDVLQATFMRALRAISRGERVQKPRNWLIKIAHNECRRALSVRSRRAEVELDDVASESVETGRAEELRRALGQLAPKQREALVLRELEGRSYAEIATTLEISGSAVETLIFRARRAVREQLENAIACEEAVELIDADPISDDDRTRLRAHTRACAECATLERQARGRKSALRRLASSLGLPWFGKVAAVALTVSAAATTTGVVLELPAHSSPPPRPAHAQTVQPAAASPVVPARVQRSTAAHAAAPVAEPVRKTAPHRPAPTRATARHAAPVGPARAAAPAATTQPTAEPTAPPIAAPTVTPPAAGPRAAAPPLAPVVPPATPTLPVPDPVASVLPPVQVPPVVAAVADPVVDGVVDPVVSSVTTPLAPVTAPVTDPVTTAVTQTVSPVVGSETTPLPTLVGGLLGHK